jgi:tetratricopeptide (TPR) repeat protein
MAPRRRAILAALAGGSVSQSGVDPEDALAELRALSLLQPAAETGCVSEGQVHRVLALITREHQAGTARTAALEAALALVDAAAVGELQDVRTWPIWAPLQPHVAGLVDAAEAAGIAEPIARLLNDLGLLLMTKAQHAEAEPLYRRALAIDEAGFGAEHPRVAIELNNLAQLLQATNRLTEAEPLMRQSLVIFLLFFRQTGYANPHLGAAFTNYRDLLGALSLDADEVRQRIGSLGSEAGLGEEAYRRLLEGL